MPTSTGATTGSVYSPVSTKHNEPPSSQTRHGVRSGSPRLAEFTGVPAARLSAISSSGSIPGYFNHDHLNDSLKADLP